MRKPMILYLVAVLLLSMVIVPRGTVSAQIITLPAEINKRFSPLSIEPGGIARLTVNVYNPNPFDLTNVSWTDNLVRLEPGLVIASPVDITNSCEGTVTATPGATSFSLSGGTVPAQSGSTPGRCSVSINVTSTAAGENLVNEIPAGALSASGGGTTISNTSPARATLTVLGTATPPPTPTPRPLPPVQLTKSFNPSRIWAGGISQLTIRITNNQSTTSLTQTSLRDDLPADVFLANPVEASLSGCGTSASLTAVSGGTFVTLNNGTIAPNSTCTIRVNVTSTVQGTHTNRIPAGRLQNQQQLSNPTDVTDNLTVEPPGIGISKQFSPGTISAGGTSTLTITLQNPTTSRLTGVRFTDNLPSPMTASAVTGNTCGGTVSISPSTIISLTGGEIPAGSPAAPGTCTISVQVTVPGDALSGRLTNTIRESTLGSDQGLSNPRPATDRITVRGTDVTASKSFLDDPITAGGQSRLRIDYIAPGDTNLTGFSIQDDLPFGLTISNFAPATTDGCGDSANLIATPGEATISLTNGFILAGQRCRITVYVTGTTAGTYTNTIPLSNISNNENRLPPAALTDDLTITAPAPGNLSITLNKGFFPDEVFGGAASTLTVELINQGNVALTGISFTDDMPDNMILANPVNFNVGSCGGTLGGAAGDGAFTFSGGALLALGRCTLTLSVTMTVNGNLINTIQAGAVTTDTPGVTNPELAEATLSNLPGASISKYFSPNPIPAGSYSMLTITIQNTGNVPLTGLGFSDSLPLGLEIAGGNVPAPVNNCGGTFTAVPGTQLLQLNGGALTGNTSCTLVTAITGTAVGAYTNTIPAGNLRTDPHIGVTNAVPATDILVIDGNPTNPVAGGDGGGRDREDRPAAVTTGFLIPVTGFKAHAETDLSQTPRETYAAAGDVTLEIPSLRIKIPVVGVPKRNGTWNVAWLGNAAGWLEGSAFPSWKGNSVLTSHVYLANGLPGPFVNLSQLKFGDKVYVYAYGEKYTFDVQTNEVVAPNDRSVMKHEEKPWLTLITCKNYDEKAATYKQRVVVRAVLVEVSAIK